jgi:Kdo2-lipid IVA lauroyltransferase/acyltransferase
MTNPLRRLHRISPRLRRLVRRTKNALIGGLTGGALWLVGCVSLDQALRLGERFGALAYFFLRTPRRLAHEHLQFAFGNELTPAGREHLARASFINIARSFCELAKIDAIRDRMNEYVEVEGWEHLEAALAPGKGAVVITGHIGNWELLAAYVAWRSVRVVAMARRIYAERVNQLLVDFRARQGVETILREHPDSARKILKALKSNAVLAMLIDQDTHTPSVSVPFFGRLARTPAAAAALAVRRDLPALAVFIHRRPQGGHCITFSPPINPERSTDSPADIRALTREFSVALETQIRRNPAEWVWWHRRWRRPPVAHLDMDDHFQYIFQDTVLPGRG